MFYLYKSGSKDDRSVRPWVEDTDRTAEFTYSGGYTRVKTDRSILWLYNVLYYVYEADPAPYETLDYECRFTGERVNLLGKKCVEGNRMREGDKKIPSPETVHMWFVNGDFYRLGDTHVGFMRCLGGPLPVWPTISPEDLAELRKIPDLQLQLPSTEKESAQP